MIINLLSNIKMFDNILQKLIAPLKGRIVSKIDIIYEKYKDTALKDISRDELIHRYFGK